MQRAKAAVTIQSETLPERSAWKPSARGEYGQDPGTSFWKGLTMAKRTAAKTPDLFDFLGLAHATDAERSLFWLFAECLKSGDGRAYLAHIGVDLDTLPPRETPAERFRDIWLRCKVVHMIGGVVSDELATQNLITFPPVAAMIAEGRRKLARKAST
jgi:hypothetical protein